MDETELNSEINRLRATLSLQRRKVKRSRLDPFESDILALRNAGARLIEIRLWLREHSVKISIPAIHEWLIRNNA